MRKQRIDVPAVREALDAICETMSGHKDEFSFSLAGLRPRFLAQGKPCCLAGMILAHLGVSPGVLRDMDSTRLPLQLISHPIQKRFTPVAWDLLIFLQGKNDSAWRWGEARRAAFRVDPYWVKINTKFAFPGEWCTLDNEIKS